jgi:hypothetical protein
VSPQHLLPGGPEPERHQRVLLVGLADSDEPDATQLEVFRDSLEVRGVARREDHDVRLGLVRALDAVADRVRDLRRLGASRQVGSDDDVVRDGVVDASGNLRGYLPARRSADVTA